MTAIPMAEWRPDMPELSQWAREALNVVPAEESYAPLNALHGVSSALDSRCQGAAWFRAPANVVKMFAGDATKLYLLDGATWSDVSRVAGGAYAPGTDGTWRFAQFGNLAIAVNGVDDPQKFDLASGSAWEKLNEDAPIGTYVTTVRDFLLMGRIGTTTQRVQWSGLNNAAVWGSVAANQADFQDLPDGGNVTGLVGGEIGIILQEAAVRRMSYEGSPVVFRIDKIANDIGCSVPGSVASVADLAFFLHKSGFYMVQGGQTIVPIGRGKVDRTFWKEFAEVNAHRCSATIDPVRGLYIFSYPTGGASDGRPNRMLIYNWRTQRWSHANVDCELVFGGVSQQSYTLEELDDFGTLETLIYSLDSSFWTGTVSLLLFGFDKAHKSGSFSGDPMHATVETAEFNPGNGRRSIIRGCRPLIDGGAPTVKLGHRDTQQQAVTYGPSVGLTSAGNAPVLASGRYFRVRADMADGEMWNNISGIDDLDVRPAGLA